MKNTTDNKHYPNISGFTQTILSVTEPLLSEFVHKSCIIAKLRLLN